MATLYTVNKRANSILVPLFFFLFLILLSAAAGEIVWFYTQNLELSIVIGGASAVLFSLWWYLFQWQINVTWLCRLQMFFFGAGALPQDYRFSDDAAPWNAEKRIKELVKTATDMVQETTKNLAANRYALDKYLGSQASRKALSGSSTYDLGGQLKSLFILFCDIRGFTQMTEKLTSQETVRTLNQVFSALSAVIESHGGEINKFIGDAVLAFFNWSEENQRAEAEKVVQAALSMQERFEMVVGNNPDLKARMVKIGLGIGIVAGHAILGNLGSRNRMEFTLIGDSVNIASRICSIAPEGEILVNETLALLVNDKFHIESRLPVQLKGKSEKMTPYCIFGKMRKKD
jgi:class 3 adenylate cyclase